MTSDIFDYLEAASPLSREGKSVPLMSIQGGERNGG
jgi:hypothetical protein